MYGDMNQAPDSVRMPSVFYDPTGNADLQHKDRKAGTLSFEEYRVLKSIKNLNVLCVLAVRFSLLGTGRFLLFRSQWDPSTGWPTNPVFIVHNVYWSTIKSTSAQRKRFSHKLIPNISAWFRGQRSSEDSVLWDSMAVTLWTRIIVSDKFGDQEMGRGHRFPQRVHADCWLASVHSLDNTSWRPTVHEKYYWGEYASKPGCLPNAQGHSIQWPPASC